MDVRVGLWRKLSAEELMLLNCGVGEDSWESLGLQGDQPVHSQGDKSWVLFGRNDTKAETPILWPSHGRVDSLEKTLVLGGIGGRRRRGRQRMRWLMASPTQWKWVSVNSNSMDVGLWWTGRPSVLWFMGSQRVRYDWTTELNWTDVNFSSAETKSAPSDTDSFFYLYRTLTLE